MSSGTTKPRVALAGGAEPRALVVRALDLEGSFAVKAARSRRVFIKPNLTYPRPSGVGAVTDARVLDALLAALRDAGAGQVIVGDGPGKSRARDCFDAAGYGPLEAKYGFRFVDLNAARTRTVDVPDARAFDRLEIPEVVLDADLFVTVSPLKTHVDGLLTLNAKNLFGIPPTRFYGAPRAIFHLRGVDEVVHDICRAVPPHYAIADATVVMELGVARGRPVALGAIAAGANLVATDAVSARLIGQEPRDCPYLRFLAEDGVGPLDMRDIDLVGDPIESLAKPLRLERTRTPRAWAEGERIEWEAAAGERAASDRL
jgi:uncharacterized protein (DUF362 family)